MDAIYISRKGLRNIVLTTLLGGMFGGFILYLGDRITTWLFVPAFVAAFVSAWIMSRGVFSGRIDNLYVNVGFAVLMSIIVYSTYQFSNYLLFRKETYDSIVKETQAQVYDVSPDSLIDEFLMAVTGTTGFIGYLQLSLERGFTITSLLTQRQTRHSGDSALIYWILDAGIVMGLTVFAAYMAANRPYCKRCHSFYGHTFMDTDNGTENFGNVDIRYSNVFLSRVHAKQFSQAGQFIRYENYPLWLEIEVDRCKTCAASPIYLTAKHMSHRPAFVRKALYKGEISIVDYYDLKEARPE